MGLEERIRLAAGLVRGGQLVEGTQLEVPARGPKPGNPLGRAVRCDKKASRGPGPQASG